MRGNLVIGLLITAAIAIYILQAEAVKPLGNPYAILGIGRLANVQEIRKAYKQLVKEWHPDKNDHPDAQNRFVEITRAYELLSDPERRRNFDNHGITEEGLNRDRRSAFHMEDPFEELFSGNFKFHYQSRDISLFHKMSVTYRAYEMTCIPKSYRAPYIVLFYSDWCFPCLQAEPTWRKLVDELEPLGVNLVTVHVEREKALAKRLNVHALPNIGVLIEGRMTIYKEPSLRVAKIIEFLRSRFPYRLVKRISNDNLESFLSGWTDNKIRALIFDKKEIPALRYMLLAYHHRDRVVFGFVQNDKFDTELITTKYKVSLDLETLLLFNENSRKPVASLSMKDIPSGTMHNIINANKFLILPRLSNQAVLDAVCPPEWKRPHKRLCAVLICENDSRHDLARHKFRQAAMASPYASEKVRYAYLFKEAQPEFLSSVSVGEGSPIDPVLRVVIFWRRDAKRLEYEWLPNGWPNAPDDDERWNKTREDLEQTIGRLLRSTTTLLHVAEVKELKDEHALGMFERVFFKALNAVDWIAEKLTRDQILWVLSVAGTIVFICAAGYGMSYLVKLEEASIQAERGNSCKNSRGSSSNPPQLRLHEMRAEKFNALVRLLKPGCRTIVLLVDNQSKFKLLPAFHKAVWPYRKNKTLMFSHLSLERGLDWYKEILSLSLPEPRELNINAKNCVGTVLSLNGHRKYFCMYHAKHPESSKGKSYKRMEKMTKQLSRPQDPEAGAFIGFDDSSGDSEVSQDESEPKVLYQENLLDGLPMWLDRLFEGTTQRYYINYWPDFKAK